MAKRTRMSIVVRNKEQWQRELECRQQLGTRNNGKENQKVDSSQEQGTMAQRTRMPMAVRNKEQWQRELECQTVVMNKEQWQRELECRQQLGIRTNGKSNWNVNSSQE